MSRLRIIRDGAYSWLDEGPARARSERISGSLVVGAHGGEARANPGSGPEAGRLASQLYRRRHKDRLNEYQRAYRARKRAEVASRARAWDNDADGSSVIPSRKLSTDARVSATTGGAGVVESVEVVAR